MAKTKRPAMVRFTWTIEFEDLRDIEALGPHVHESFSAEAAAFAREFAKAHGLRPTKGVVKSRFKGAKS